VRSAVNWVEGFLHLQQRGGDLGEVAREGLVPFLAMVDAILLEVRREVVFPAVGVRTNYDGGGVGEGMTTLAISPAMRALAVGGRGLWGR